MEHFVEAHARLSTSADTIRVLRDLYFGRATPGLQLYMSKYGLNDSTLREGVRRFPEDYAAVGKRLAWLRTQHDSIQHVYAKFAERVPIKANLPAFFLVGAHTGTASGSEVGPLFSMENGAVNGARPNLPEFLAHELTHIQQFTTIGMPRYQSIFNERMSLLNYTVREGIAEFIADEVTGKLTQERARQYLRPNLRSVWERYRLDMCKRETGDWMFTRPKDPQQPSNLAYALGAEIARTYVSSRSHRGQAVAELLAVDDHVQFLLESGFAQAMGESAEALRDLVRACPR
jgi:hypothetical protein